MKKFTPHMMYSGKKSVKANSVEEHNSLAKKGYTHDAPKAKGGMKIKYKAGGKLDPPDKLYLSRISAARNLLKKHGGVNNPNLTDAQVESAAKIKKLWDEAGSMAKQSFKKDPTETLKGSASVDKIFYKGGKTRVNEAGNYTKPTMRKNLFNRIMAGTRGGNAGQWSARKAQLLAKLYKQKGGGYTS